MIKKWGKKVIDYFFNPCPTLFDLCVCFGILGIAYISKPLRGFYLEFYTIFLVVVGFYFDERRSYKSAGLTILCLLGLTSMLLHSYYAIPGGFSFQYLNFYLMHEGFGYIFFTALLFVTVVTKATNIRLLAITLPFVIWKALWAELLFTGSMSPMLSIGVGFFAYLIYKKKYKWATLVILITLNIIAYNYKWLIMKFGCRPHVWAELLRYIKHIPNLGSNVYSEVFRSTPLSMLVGSGFNKLFVPDNMLAVKSWGNYWLFRHNDYLSLMAYIGVFSIVPIFLFIKGLFIRFRRTWFIAPLAAFCALSFFQITFVNPVKVSVIMLSLACFYVES